MEENMDIMSFSEELGTKVSALIEKMEGKDVEIIPDSNGMVLVRRGSQEYIDRIGKVLVYPANEEFVVCEA
jgi:dihydroxyacetone kinase DhaKLM complex PTS-EIIA-like component DhaM